MRRNLLRCPLSWQGGPRAGQCLQRLVELQPIGLSTAFYLGKLSDDLPTATIEVRRDGCALSVESQTASPLAIGGDSVVSDKFPLRDQSKDWAYEGTKVPARLVRP